MCLRGEKQKGRESSALSMRGDLELTYMVLEPCLHITTIYEEIQFVIQGFYKIFNLAQGLVPVKLAIQFLCWAISSIQGHPRPVPVKRQTIYVVFLSKISTSFLSAFEWYVLCRAQLYIQQHANFYTEVPQPSFLIEFHKSARNWSTGSDGHYSKRWMQRWYLHIITSTHSYNRIEG